MKNFKDFKKKSKPPVVILAQPVHGKHSMDKKPSQRVVKEDSENHPYKDWLKGHDNSHLHDSPDGVREHMEAQHNHTVHGYGDRVQAYTANSGELNNNLIQLSTPQGKKKSPFRTKSWMNDSAKHYNRQHVKKFKDNVRELDAAIGDHKLDHDLHVYHGTSNWHPGKESAKHPQGHVMLPTYLSTSTNRARAHEFSFEGDYGAHGRHILHIHAKKGQSGVYVGNRSSHRGEDEYIMPRKTTLKIHPEPTKLSDGTHIWHSEVVHK